VQLQEDGGGNRATIAQSPAAGAYTYAYNNPYAQSQTGQRPDSSGSASAATAQQGAYSSQILYNNYSYQNQQMHIPPVGAIARQPFTQAQMSPLDELLGVVGPGLVSCPSKNNNDKDNGHNNENDNGDDEGDSSVGCSLPPVDVQTAHYSLPKDNVPIVGNPLNVSVSAVGDTATTNENGNESENEMQLPTIVEYPQPEEVIAGFPLGAGPEGRSHAGDFEYCALNLRNRRRVSNEF
jgi:hypothetical protein